MHAFIKNYIKKERDMMKVTLKLRDNTGCGTFTKDLSKKFDYYVSTQNIMLCSLV